MKNKLVITILSITIVCSIFISSTKSVQFSSVSPDGYTGATGVYCTNCHSDYPLNAAGGNVMLQGLPTGNYVPNATYNLSLKINHFTNDRTRWGFAIKAVNNAGNAVGTFSTTNTNAYINGDEISHFYAITTSSQSSFTYDSLKWTAPATAGNATFYYAGNAANNSAGNDGDYIYSGVSAITLPIYLKDFTANIIDRGVSLYWESTINNKFDFFEIERSDDGQFFFKVGTINANTNNSSFKYNFIDNKVSSNNQSNVFYRLKSIDKNGDTHYSKTVSIQTRNTELIIKNIYP
ncbi:MAG: choice-of-anchor V domain-containing protein, partial [Chitinophagaceae bacterium]